MIAPTLRSIPAVRIIRLCAAATMPTIWTCCRISVKANGEKNLDPNNRPNTAIATSNTIKGTSDGLACSVCCTWPRTPRRRSSNSATASDLLAAASKFSVPSFV